jgi:hypothetical protein
MATLAWLRAAQAAAVLLVPLRLHCASSTFARAHLRAVARNADQGAGPEMRCGPQVVAAIVPRGGDDRDAIRGAVLTSPSMSGSVGNDISTGHRGGSSGVFLREEELAPASLSSHASLPPGAAATVAAVPVARSEVPARSFRETSM